MKDINNTSELKEFVEDQKLSDANSNIRFKAKIEIKTSKNVGEFETEVIIRFDGYNSAGKLTILESSINPYQFPEEFEAKYQSFEYLNNEYLQIEGKHPKKEIGSYKVDITPLKK